MGWWFGGIKGIVLGDLAGRGIGCLIFMNGVSSVSSVQILDQIFILLKVVASCILFALVIFFIQQGIPALVVRLLAVSVVGSIGLFLYWKWVGKSQELI